MGCNYIHSQLSSGISFKLFPLPAGPIVAIPLEKMTTILPATTKSQAPQKRMEPHRLLF